MVFVGNTDSRADIQINEQTRLAERQQKQQKHSFHIYTLSYMYCIYIYILAKLADWLIWFGEINFIILPIIYLYNFLLASIFICWCCALCVIAILFWLHSFLKIVIFKFFDSMVVCVSTFFHYNECVSNWSYLAGISLGKCQCQGEQSQFVK